MTGKCNFPEHHSSGGMGAAALVLLIIAAAIIASVARWYHRHARELEHGWHAFLHALLALTGATAGLIISAVITYSILSYRASRNSRPLDATPEEGSHNIPGSGTKGRGSRVAQNGHEQIPAITDSDHDELSDEALQRTLEDWS